MNTSFDELQLINALVLAGEERRRNTVEYWSDLARKEIAKGDAALAGAWARNAAYLALREMRAQSRLEV